MSLTISPSQIIEESDSPLLRIPEGWPRVELGEVASILNGFAFKSTFFAPGDGFPLIRIRDIFNTSTAVGYVGDYDERYVVQPDELLVGMDGDFNCARWSGPPALLNQRVCKISPDDKMLDLDYLTLVLPGYLNAIHEATSSTTVTHLSSRDIARIPLPVPSLDLQRSITGAVRGGQVEADASLDHVVSARRALAQLRRSVLLTAFSGELTADWREENPGAGVDDAWLAELAGALGRGSKTRQRQLSVDGTAEIEGAIASWRAVRLGDVLAVASGATPLRSNKAFYGGDIPWVTSGAVNAGLITEAKEYITARAIAETGAKVFPAGTLLIAMYGEGQTRGRVGQLAIAAATNQAVAAILFPPGSEVLRDYVRLHFEANYARMRGLSFGGVQTNLSLGAIKDTVLHLAPLEEQREIVRRVTQLLATADKLTAHLDRASRAIERTSLAVRAKAFRGELIA